MLGLIDQDIENFLQNANTKIGINYLMHDYTSTPK